MLKKMCWLLFAGMAPIMVDTSCLEAKDANIQVVESSSWLEKWAKSDKDVLKQFMSFQASLEKGVEKGALTIPDVQKINSAVSFAAKKHREQFRQNGKKTPYIVHPIGVANHIVTIGQVYDVDIIIAALLHDVMDGTDASYDEIAAEFGLEVTKYVQEVSADPKLSDKEQKKQQIVKAPKQSKGATIIRLADKLYNLNTLMKDPSKGWSQDSLDGYFQWVHAVVDQLPKANDPLKDAVHKTIATYWESQGGEG